MIKYHKTNFDHHECIRGVRRKKQCIEGVSLLYHCFLSYSISWKQHHTRMRCSREKTHLTGSCIDLSDLITHVLERCSSTLTPSVQHSAVTFYGVKPHSYRLVYVHCKITALTVFYCNVVWNV